MYSIRAPLVSNNNQMCKISCLFVSLNSVLLGCFLFFRRLSICPALFMNTALYVACFNFTKIVPMFRVYTPWYEHSTYPQTVSSYRVMGSWLLTYEWPKGQILTSCQDKPFFFEEGEGRERVKGGGVEGREGGGIIRISCFLNNVSKQIGT